MKYAITNGKILDGTKDMQVQENLVILVEDGKIQALVPAGTDLIGYEIIDLAGKYIMPGLINMHVHLAGSGKPQKKQRDNEKLVNQIMSTGLTRKIALFLMQGSIFFGIFFGKIRLLSGAYSGMISLTL